jgi:hypothetical protein
MVRFLAGLVILLHGLVHLWFAALARGLVAFKPKMGWSGKSWLVTGMIGDSATRSIAAVMLVIVTAGLSVGGVAFAAHQSWSRPLLLISAGLSAATLLLFWDGSMQLIVQKGLIGLTLDLAIIIGLLLTA